VLIVGEPGLGKSRLIGEFRARLGETPHTWVEWSASQLLQNTPLHPITEWGRQRFGADAPAEQRLADLEGTLRLIGLDPGENAPLLAPLVDIPLPPSRVVNFPPEELRRRQLAAMTAWVLAGARSQPVVLALEDLHWADPTSLDLLRAFTDRCAQAPMFLLATTRPEFRPPWSLRSHHSLISLSPLDRAGVARMVGEISARHAFSKELIEGVTERTGGVPLFVEEVTRLLIERGEQGGVHAIPPTLQQSLAARLDRLGPAREIAQIGAVLGRDFAYPLLREAAEIDDPALQASLDRLAEADLLFVEGTPPEANYRFKHALIQDAAYDSLLKSRRQALHWRAAEALREAKAEPEAIAHHYTEAGLDDLAIEWWGKAGDQALRRSAFQEAIAHLGRAIAMADRAAGAKAADASGDRARLQVAYGNALIQGRGHGAPETTEAFASVRGKSADDKDAPNGWRPTTAFGSAASFGANCRRCERMPRRSSAMSNQDLTRPRRASLIAPSEGRIGSPESIAKREIISIARSPCLNQAGTTISPSVLDMTLERWRWFISRLSFGRWGTSDVRFPSSAAVRRDRRASLMSPRAYTRICTRPCSNSCAATSRAPPHTLLSSLDLPASTICRCGALMRFFSRVLRGARVERAAAGLRRCAPERSCCAKKVLSPMTASSRSRSPRPRPLPAPSTAPSRSSTKRWRRASGPDIARPKRSCTASAAKCC
jgi:hypothetical protein